MSAPIDYVKTLAALAANPVQELSRFEKISPQHETAYSYDRLRVVIGIATVILSAGIAIKSVKISLAGFSIAALVLYSSVSSEKVETEKYKAHKETINAKFDPCIEGLKTERRKKMQVIEDTIHGKPKTSLEDVKNSIDEVSAIYDGLKDPSEYAEPLVGTRELDQDSYTSIRESSKQLMDLQIASLPDAKNIDSYAKAKLITLCSTAKLFYVGDDKGTNSVCDDAYAHYGFYKTAIISPWELKI